MAKNKVVNENVNNDVFSDNKLESAKKSLNVFIMTIK